MSENPLPLGVKETVKTPPSVLTSILLFVTLPTEKDAKAAAVTPVPHDNVSLSTPLSNVRT